MNLSVLLAILLILGSIPLPAAEPVRLTTDGKLKFSPVFINDGKEIVYADLERPELYRLQRLNLEKKTAKPLHATAATSEFEPAFSADGKIYTYLRTRGVLSISVMIRNTADNTEAEVMPGPGFSGLRSPAVAPDGSRVAYVYADGGRQQIYSVDAKGAGKKALTDSPGLNNWPCYSPDGKKIVFSSTRDDNYEVYVMDTDGKNQRRLTKSPFQDLRPRYSPDGKRIAFTSHRDGNAEIYLMNSEGTNPRRLTNNPERDDYPAWHPDGKRLVIVSERAGQHDLYMIDVGD